MNLSGIALNGLTACSERIFFKNVVFEMIQRDVVRSACRYLTMKECGGLQHLLNTKMYECEQACLIKCDVLRENLKNFGSKLTILKI